MLKWIKGRNSLNKSIYILKRKRAVMLVLNILLLVALLSGIAFAAPTGMEIMKSSADTIKKLNNFDASATISQYMNGKVNMTMRVNVQLMLKELVTKVEVLDGTFRDTVWVINEPKNKAMIYMSVNKLCSVGTVAKILSSSPISFPIDKISSLLVFDTNDLKSAKYLRTEKFNKEDCYVVEIQTKDSPTTFQQVWVSIDTKFVVRVDSFNSAGVKTEQIVIDTFKPNVSTMTVKKLETMPQGTKFNYI